MFYIFYSSGFPQTLENLENLENTAFRGKLRENLETHLEKKLLRENILYLQDTQGKIIFGNKFKQKLSYEFQPSKSIFVTPFIQFIFSSSTVKLLLHDTLLFFFLQATSVGPQPSKLLKILAISGLKVA